MSGAKNDKRREALLRLADALVEDLFATSDQEILGELAKADEAGNGAEEMCALFEDSVLKANKQRLRAARQGLAAEHKNALGSSVVDMANVRDRFRRALAACPPDVRLTLAARNESELSDADMLGMLQDLEELGITIPKSQGDT